MEVRCKKSTTYAELNGKLNTQIHPYIHGSLQSNSKIRSGTTRPLPVPGSRPWLVAHCD